MVRWKLYDIVPLPEEESLAFFGLHAAPKLSVTYHDTELKKTILKIKDSTRVAAVRFSAGADIIKDKLPKEFSSDATIMWHAINKLSDGIFMGRDNKTFLIEKLRYTMTTNSMLDKEVVISNGILTVPSLALEKIVDAVKQLDREAIIKKTIDMIRGYIVYYSNMNIVVERSYIVGLLEEAFESAKKPAIAAIFGEEE